MLGFPGRKSNFLNIPPSVGEPVVELTLCHVGIAGEVVLLGLGGVGVLVMCLQPLDQHNVISLRFCRSNTAYRIGAVRGFFVTILSLSSHDRHELMRD